MTRAIHAVAANLNKVAAYFTLPKSDRTSFIDDLEFALLKKLEESGKSISFLPGVTAWYGNDVELHVRGSFDPVRLEFDSNGKLTGAKKMKGQAQPVLGVAHINSLDDLANGLIKFWFKGN